MQKTITDPIERILAERLVRLRSAAADLPIDIKHQQEKLDGLKKQFADANEAIAAITEMYPNIQDPLKPKEDETV